MDENSSKDSVVVSIMKRGESNPKTVRTQTAPAGSFSLTEISFIDPAGISPSPYQTREIESESDVEALAKSIAAKGMLQPIIVRPLPAGAAQAFELVAGERRLRAAKLAGVQMVPAVVKDLSDRQALEISVIENAQRENLNPVEEALAFRQLVEKFHLTQAEAAQIAGKNRATVANTLRLLSLDPRVLEILKQGALSAGHGRALLMLSSQDDQFRLAKRAVRAELSVRALEAIVSRRSQEEEEIGDEEAGENRETAALERQEAKISDWLGIEKVSLRHNKQGKKSLSLTFDTEAAWKRFLARIRA